MVRVGGGEGVGRGVSRWSVLGVGRGVSRWSVLGVGKGEGVSRWSVFRVGRGGEVMGEYRCAGLIIRLASTEQLNAADKGSFAL